LISKFEKVVIEEVHKVVPAIEKYSKPSMFSSIWQSRSLNTIEGLPQLEMKTSLSLDPDESLDLVRLNSNQFYIIALQF